jgi:hypothetical protein
MYAPMYYLPVNAPFKRGRRRETILFFFLFSKKKTRKKRLKIIGKIKIWSTIAWTPLAYLSHIKRRSHDDRFLASQWEVLICSSLGVPTPALLGPSQEYGWNVFEYDPFGDHLQTCRTKSAVSQVHDWVVYKLGVLLGSVGHRVKIHNITTATGKERGDMEIKDYVVIQKPQVSRLPPPHALIIDYTMTHVRFGRSHLHPMGQLTNTRRSDGAPDPDADFKEVVRIKIRYYRNLYLNHPDPIAFIPLAVDTTGRMSSFAFFVCRVSLI